MQGQTRQQRAAAESAGEWLTDRWNNKMDCDVAKYGKERYDEIVKSARMLSKVGWGKKEFIEDSVPVLSPISAWTGDKSSSCH